MTDDSTQGMFNEEVVKKTLGSVYILTSVRQLIRMLDIGLVVPELVACIDDVIATFGTDQLPSLNTIKGYPRVPVLLELKHGTTKLQSVYPASTIKTIHFASQDELEDYQARGFENVPNSLFSFEVTPALFEKGPHANVIASLPKINRSALRENYREYDVLAGLLWDSIVQATAASELVSLLRSLVTHSDVPAALNAWIQYRVDTGNLPNEDNGLLSTYLHLLGGRDIDEGWASGEVLEELASQVIAPIADSENFKKWYQYSKAVINNQKKLSALTDDGDVLLRAILLHLLNPDVESVKRMTMRDPAPGSKVLAMARALAATRLGFAPLDAAGKEERPGAFWLVSDLIAGYINNNKLELNELHIDDESGVGSLVLWHDQTVGIYVSQPQQPTNADSEKVQEIEETYLSLIELQQMAEGLDIIESTSIDEGLLALVLTKTAAKPLPKQATFVINMQSAQGGILTTRLLDLSMKSHKAKLTGKRTLAALVYQTDQGADFRFETQEDEHFSAQLTLPQEINQQSLQTALQRLFYCHAWMKIK
ncbi:hypothetical protein EH243_03810 [Amphritea opalescens]|uniref:Uncharacterized protein n=1 Tax=Amphritea opalescens TaxID=2490544 RepID=A0A430KV08_9GAMM|nr:hypothetical protein [Amphritea opalescens]RTE67337.1 hypothetical protein EH243_03810 [Amphritea opalescens]